MDETTGISKKKRWRPSRKTFWSLLIVTVTFGALAWVLLTPLIAFMKKTEDWNCMAEIFQASYLFEEEHGHFPFLKNQHESVVSWRVNLLPALGQYMNHLPHVVEQVDFVQKHYDEDLPWDSSTNELCLNGYSLNSLIPFRVRWGKTKYLALKGLETIWSETEKLSRIQLLEKYGNPAIVAISPETPVPWTQPRDLVLTKDNVTLEGEPHPVDLRGQLVLYLDGTVDPIPEGISYDEMVQFLWAKPTR